MFLTYQLNSKYFKNKYLLKNVVEILIFTPSWTIYVSSNFLIQNLICHINNIYNFCSLLNPLSPSWSIFFLTLLSLVLFSTLFTFIIFVSIMNNFSLSFWITTLIEEFFTIITFVIFGVFSDHENNFRKRWRRFYVCGKYLSE